MAGRLLQGLGGGAATVVLYVVVGLIYPAGQETVRGRAGGGRCCCWSSSSFGQEAWVLPALFGPFLAAPVAAAVGWRWVFLGMVGWSRSRPARAPRHWGPRRRVTGGRRRAPPPGCGWAGRLAVLALELLGSAGGAAGRSAWPPAPRLVVVSLRRLLPPARCVGRRGLPSVIATRAC